MSTAVITVLLLAGAVGLGALGTWGLRRASALVGPEPDEATRRQWAGVLLRGALTCWTVAVLLAAGAVVILLPGSGGPAR